VSSEIPATEHLDAFSLGGRYLCVSTPDLVEAQATIGRIYRPFRWKTPYSLRPAMAPISLHHAPLGDVSLSTISYGRAVEIQPEADEGAMIVLATLEGCVEVVSGAQQTRCTAGGFAVISSPQTTKFIYGETCRVLKVGLDKRRAEALCWRFLGGSRKKRLDFDLAMTDPVLRQRWVAFVRLLVQMAHTGFDNRRDVPMATSLQEMLLASLLLGQPNAHSDELGASGSKTLLSRQLRRAVDFIENHADEAITASRIAQESGCSERSLWRGFASSMNTTPMRYLRDLRLRRVRAELLNSDRQRETVIAVASRWGFAHMGEFGRHYRTLFGESPTQTRGSSRVPT